MPKAVAICRAITSGVDVGAPNIGNGWQRWVRVGDLPGAYAVFIIVGTAAQLTAIQANANCVGGILVTAGPDRWAELDQPVPAALRTKINAYLTAQGQPTIGVNVTLLQVIRKAAAEFDWQTHDVWDGP
jgi:hypothetical protein